jgi:superfamily II DNA or RNA helicase
MLMKLWPHQEQAELDLGTLSISGSKSILVASPTGAGKTLLQQRQIERATESYRRVAHYSNRRWLLKQTSDVLTQHGITHGIRMAGEDPLLDEDVQLCSVQTELHRVYKNKKWSLHNANLAIVDEAHLHGTGTSHRIISDHQEAGATVVGYTATPLGLGHLYDDLVVAGVNSELRQCKAHLPCYVFSCGELDTSKIKRQKSGEFSIREIRKSVWTTKIFGHVIRHHNRLNPDLKPAIGFAPGVAESMWLADQYCKSGIRAAHIDGQDCWMDGEAYKSNQDARNEIVRQWKNGDIKIVWNRFVMREGLDFPWLYHLILPPRS